MRQNICRSHLDIQQINTIKNPQNSVSEKKTFNRAFLTLQDIYPGGQVRGIVFLKKKFALQVVRIKLFRCRVPFDHGNYKGTSKLPGGTKFCCRTCLSKLQQGNKTFWEGERNCFFFFNCLQKRNVILVRPSKGKAPQAVQVMKTIAERSFLLT